MPFYEREDLILNALLEKESMSIRELSTKLFVSVPTLRRDLIKLEEKGRIMRTHGGAKLLKRAADEQLPFFYREQVQNDSKSIIARKAVELIQDGDVIMLDGSTSAYSLVPLLADFKKIIVITSSAKAAIMLGQMGINNICTGGHMINRVLSYVGEDAEKTVRNYNADIVFFSGRGADMQGNITDSSIEENRLRRVMMEQSKKRILLLDSSKLGETYLNTLCHLSEVDEVICESPIPHELMEMLRK